MISNKRILVLTSFLALLASGSAWAQQYARPDATTDGAGFTPVNAATHHEALDEVAVDTSDYIDSGVANSATAILSLSGVSDPGVGTGHILRYNCKVEGSKGPEECNAALYDGGTLIYEVTANQPAARGAWETFSFTIPTANADLISSGGYANLTLHLTSVVSSKAGDGDSAQFSWAELEVPGAAVTAPTVTSPTFADVTDTTATLGGNVTNDNGTTVTSRGVEWGTSPGGPYPNSVPEGGGGTGVFTVPVTGLPSSTTIYFRAWADNGATGYSAENSFTTDAPAAPPSVTTAAASGIGQNSATLGGNVTADGGAAVTARGVYWDTTANAENGTQVPMGSGLGSFSQAVSGLPAGTLIYHRAYATNSAGTTLGSELTFTTLAGLPTVDSPTFADITATTATLGGTVQSDGGATVTARGVEWGTTSGGPYPNIEPAAAGGTGTFTVPVTGLPTGTPVFFRAYATNSAGTAYSAQASFTPAGPPIVTATPAASITLNSAILGGEVTNDGGSTVIQSGIVWNTTSPPESGGTIVPMGSGIGSFTQTVSGLPAATTIYWKAYGTNSVSTGYSALEQFDTLSEPTVQVTNLATPTIAGRSVRITWTRGNGDGALIVMRLQATGRTDPADGDDYTANPDFTAATSLVGGAGNLVVYKGSGTSVIVTGLTMTTDYQIVAYEYAGTGAAIDYLLTAAPEVAATTTEYAVHNYDYGVACGNCHDHGSFNSRGTELKAICETCHNSSGVAQAKLEFDNHLAPNKNPAVDFVDCGVCHEVHNLSATNTTESFNNVTGLTQHNKSFLRANVDKYISTAVPPAYLHTDQPRRVDPHPDAPQEAITPDRAVEGGTDAVDPSTSSQARGYCQVCHTMTNYHTNNPGTSSSVQTHDGQNNDQGLGTEVNCGHCHEHNNKFIGVGGTTTCIECHDQIQGARDIITTQFDRNSTHIPGGSAAVTEPDCLVCHNQGGHTGGAVSVWNVDDGATAYTQPTASASTLATGEGEAFAPHCLSCHDSNGADSLPASGSDQTKLSPFIGSGAPPIIDATAWSNAAHNIPTPSSTPMTCVGDGANGCHASGHGSESNALLAPAAGPAQSTTDFCFTCHDGTVATDVTADFAGAAITATSASGALVNNRHDVSAADQTYSGGVVTCAGCHNPHEDQAGASVSDINLGGALRNYAVGNSYSSDGQNFAYDSGGNLDPLNPEGATGGPYTEPDYIQFCLACHDGTTPPGVTMSPNMINIAAEYGATDQHGAQDGETGGRTGKGALKFPYVTSADDAADNDPTAPYAAMNCSTCHGAHGTGNIFNLRESITVAGVAMTVGGAAGFLDEPAYNGSTTYTLPLIGGQQTDHYWGAWCTFCHKGDAHPGKVEADACTGAHMHGGGSW